MGTEELGQVAHRFLVVANDGSPLLCEARWTAFVESNQEHKTIRKDFFGLPESWSPRPMITFEEYHWNAVARFERKVWNVVQESCTTWYNSLTANVGMDRELAVDKTSRLTEERRGVIDVDFERIKNGAAEALHDVAEKDIPALVIELKEGFAARSVERLT